VPEIRDISHLLKTLQNMEDNNQKNNTESNSREISSKQSHLTVFNNNHHFAFIYRKTEKLVTAVYMITNFIKDNEPLKWKIREKALSLMSLNLAFTTVSLSDRKTLLKEYQALSIEIVSLSTIGYHSGLISEMNFLILKREFDTLVEVIQNDEHRKMNEETVMLSSAFFDTGSISTHPESLEKASFVRERNDFYKGHTEDIKAPVATPQKALEKKEASAPQIKDKKVHGVVQEKKTGRQGVIIDLLKKKQGLNIKDFSEVISGCSEKTIQRELLAMVASKTLRKEGERRWSKYYLI